MRGRGAKKRWRRRGAPAIRRMEAAAESARRARAQQLEARPSPASAALSPSQVRALGVLAPAPASPPPLSAEGALERAARKDAEADAAAHGELLVATAQELADVQQQIDSLRAEARAVAGADDAIDTSHAVLHCKLLQEKQSELLDALAESPDDESIMNALKAVAAELATATPPQGLREAEPAAPFVDEGVARRLESSGADAGRLLDQARQSERDEADEPDDGSLQRTTSSAARVQLRLPTLASDAGFPPGLTPDEAMLCAQAFSADNGGIDAVRRHCALQLSGAHATCGIPLHERLSLATDLLNVANFPPGSHLQQDAEWAGALLEGILPQTLDALALTREQREFFEPAQWSVEGVPREEDGSLRALLSTVHRLPCIWALLVVMTSAPPAPSASNARGYEGGGRLFYDARARTLLRGLASLYRVEWSKVLDMERMWLAQSVTTSSELESAGNVVEGAHDKPFNYKRAAKIGSATVIGGAGKLTAPSPSACPRIDLTRSLVFPALALTGGIAAPAVAAVFGAVGSAIGIGGALTAMGSATAVSIMFGAAGAGLAGHSVAKRTGDIKVCRGLYCLSC